MCVCGWARVSSRISAYLVRIFSVFQTYLVEARISDVFRRILCVSNTVSSRIHLDTKRVGDKGWTRVGIRVFSSVFDCISKRIYVSKCIFAARIDTQRYSSRYTRIQRKYGSDQILPQTGSETTHLPWSSTPESAKAIGALYLSGPQLPSSTAACFATATRSPRRQSAYA